MKRIRHKNRRVKKRLAGHATSSDAERTCQPRILPCRGERLRAGLGRGLSLKKPPLTRGFVAEGARSRSFLWRWDRDDALYCLEMAAGRSERCAGAAPAFGVPDNAVDAVCACDGCVDALRLTLSMVTLASVKSREALS